MEGTKDIKNFTKFPSLSDDDLLLGSKTSLGGTDAAITVANFKAGGSGRETDNC